MFLRRDFPNLFSDNVLPVAWVLTLILEPFLRLILTCSVVCLFSLPPAYRYLTYKVYIPNTAPRQRLTWTTEPYKMGL